MITVIVVIIVVIIFCCFVPFWRALKKRDHHWEDPENDPRWDLDNFQFSTTSPRAERKLGDNDYNSLSVSSNNNSSTHTSNSAVNSSFRNNYQLPRWFIEDRIFKILIYFLLFDETVNWELTFQIHWSSWIQNPQEIWWRLYGRSWWLQWRDWW